MPHIRKKNSLMLSYWHKTSQNRSRGRMNIEAELHLGPNTEPSCSYWMGLIVMSRKGRQTLWGRGEQNARVARIHSATPKRGRPNSFQWLGHFHIRSLWRTKIKSSFQAHPHQPYSDHPLLHLILFLGSLCTYIYLCICWCAAMDIHVHAHVCVFTCRHHLLQ